MKRLLAAVIYPLLLFSCSSLQDFSFHEDQIIPKDFSGIVHAGNSRTKTEMAFLEKSGVKWVMRTFDWGLIQPYQDEWDFLELDAVVDTVIASGIKMLGVLAYDNWWIHNDNSVRIVTKENLPHFLEYVRGTVEHFRGRVSAWCIWNEPNTSYFWRGTDEEYYELTRQAAYAVKETDPEAILLCGAFNRGILGLQEKFIRGLFEWGAMEKADGVAFHPYELNPVRTILLFDEFKKIMNDYGFADKIWITEVGYPTGGMYPTKIRERRLPEYVVKTYILLAASGSRKLFWYQLFDPPVRSMSNSENFFGLVRSRRDYTSKGMKAFSLCAEYLADSICYTQIPWLGNLPKSLKVFWFKKEGGGTLVLWNEGVGSKQVNLSFPGTDHLSHNITSGEASPIPAKMSVKIGGIPVFITWQETPAQSEFP
jgi:hypothetical protein